MKEFMELLKKKKSEGKTLDGEAKKAKMGVLNKLHGHMNDEIGRDVGSLKKVTIAAPTKEGLEEGIDKAEEMVESGAMDMASSEDSEEESEDEGYLSKASELAEMLSPEEKEKLISILKMG